MDLGLSDMDLGLEMGIGGPPEVYKAPGPAKVSYTHDKMIDYIISQPRITNNQLAALFGYTPPWVSQIMSSDAFKERLAARRTEVTDPTIRAALDCWFPSTTESMQHLVEKSLEILKEKLSQPKVPDAVALKAFELGARGLNIGGFGNRLPEPTERPEADRLERLADRLTGLLHMKKSEVIEGELVVAGTGRAMPGVLGVPGVIGAPSVSSNDGGE